MTAEGSIQRRWEEVSSLFEAREHTVQLKVVDLSGNVSPPDQITVLVSP